MLSVSIDLKIKAECQEEFEAVVSGLVRDVHANEPGCLPYGVRRFKDGPLRYLYFLVFEDQAAYDRYSDAKYHTDMSPTAVACLDGDPVFSNLESFY